MKTLSLSKKIYLTSILLFQISLAFSQIKEISCPSAGSLGKQISEGEWKEITELKVNGNINPEDLSTIRHYSQKDSGQIKKVDLSQSNIVVISDEAFFESNILEEVILPSGVTVIGKSAFAGCRNLKKIDLPLKLSEIGSYAFAECDLLTSVHIPSNIDKIPDGCFADCKSLENVALSKSITRIGKEAFARCTQLSRIEIPSSVTSIGGGAFAGCNKLSFIKVDPQNKKYCSTSGGVLYSKDGKYILQYPAGKTDEKYTIPSGVIRVGSYSFSGCQNIKEIIIPATCTSVGYGAFFECKKLHDVTLPNGMDKIDEDLFYGCESLENIEIPASVKSIGLNAFNDCKKLKSIKLPDGIQSIGKQAFFGCSSLKNVNIPDNIKEIPEQLFANCSSLTKVDLPYNLTKISTSAFANDSSLTTISIPTSVEELYPTAFYNCVSLKDIRLGEGLKTISDAVFANCSSLRTIAIPNSVDSIGMGTFFNCDSMQTITLNNPIPAKSFAIASYAFTDTVKLIVKTGTEEQFHNAEGWKYFKHINNKTYDIIHETPESEFNSNFSLIEGANASASGSFIYSTVQTQSIEQRIDSTVYEMSEVENIPSYKNGLQSFFNKNKHIPTTIKYNGKYNAEVALVIEKDGSISNVEILKGINDEIDAEIVSVLFSSEKWNPAEKEDKIVRCKYQTTIEF